jgi:peptide-methionine (S)-S-oxide reductase
MENRQIATFGGGCFWCIEAVVQRLRGVENIVSGYTGGTIKNPSYREIGSGTTGHAEVVQVTFDPRVISYEDLITIFMTSHDPTTLDRQGADRGTQYRSAIFYHDDIQKATVAKVISEIKGSFSSPIVTQVSAVGVFYPAEAEHQDFYNNNTSSGYCRVVIDPKIKKLRDMHADKLKLQEVS